MEYRNVVLDFASRTRKNLEYVRNAALREAGGEPEVFEVTQLINSMLGLLVFPKEHYFQQIPKVPLDQLPALGWPVVQTTGGFPPAADLRELFRYLRNAVAHFNIEFLAPRGQVEGIRVWNKNDGKKNWEAELTLTQLQQITDRFIESLEEWTKPQPKGSLFDD